MSSLQIARIANIPIKIHWTFGLLVVFITGYGLYNGMNALDLIWFLGFIFAMFICVILHEYGHALSARRYGVKTIDVIISPIGGLARLERLPEKPIQELIVAIAGPMVNIVIGLFLFLGLYLWVGDLSFLEVSEDLRSLTSVTGFLGLLIYSNVVLFVFNLVPAFPMDGGRILRALLSMRYGRLKGTSIASIIGRVLAIVFMVSGILFGQYMWIFLGAFVFMMARSENNQVFVESLLRNHSVDDLVNSEYTQFHTSVPLRSIFDKYIRTGERNFLIIDFSGDPIGVIPEMFLKKANATGILDETTAGAYMSQKWLEIPEGASLEILYHEMSREGAAMAIIKNGDQIRGVIDRHSLQNFIQLYS